MITSTDIPDMRRDLTYKILDRMRYDEMYQAVWRALKNGACIGIYP